MRIFSAKSPLDRLAGAKPKPAKLKPGKLQALAKRMGPLLETKSILDKVYSNGYFENHYPDADELLKKTLHDRAMQAWAHAKAFGKNDKEVESEDESGEREEEKNINVVINIG